MKRYNVYLRLYARGLPYFGNLGYGRCFIDATSEEEAKATFNTHYHNQVVQDLVKPVFFLSSEEDFEYLAIPKEVFQQHVWDIHIVADEVV